MTRLSTGALLDGFTFGDNGDQAGGYVTGISIGYDGTAKTMAVRADVYNAWIKGPSDTIWRQAFTPTSLPVGESQYDAGFTSHSNKTHCYDIQVAPSDHTKLVGTFNAFIWKSSDTGNSWTKINGLPSAGLALDTNAGPHPGNGGDKLAIDPGNPNAWLFGSENDGLFYCLDGANATQIFLQVGGVNQTNGSSGGVQWGSRVACDPASTVSGGIHQRWFAMLQGTGVFKSETGPIGPYTQMTGGPTSFVWCLVPDQNGHLWACENAGHVWRWDSTNGWVDITATATNAPNSMISVAINPNVTVNPGTSGHVYVFDNGQRVSWSDDGGNNWHATLTGSVGNQYDMLSTNVPWLAKGNNAGLPGVLAKFDPSQSNKLYGVCGIGIYWCNPPQSQGQAKPWFAWYEESLGQKELVANKALIPPGGFPLLACWDRPLWYQTDIGVVPQGPFRPVHSAQYDATRGIDYCVDHCWDLDYAADNSRWIFAYVNWTAPISCGVSTDGGKTWGVPAAQPSLSTVGGCCAVGNTGNVIILPSNNGQPRYTKNNGADGWPILPFPGLPPAGSETGFGQAYSTHAYCIAYDKTGGAFYLYNYGPGSTGIGGVYKSTTQGDTWTKVHGTIDAYGKQSPLRFHAVPGQAGHLLYTSGDTTSAALYRSTNGGVDFAVVSNITNARCIGFGKAAPGQTYPAVYVHGAKAGVYGWYYSTDACATWNLMTSYIANNGDTPLWIAGHPDRFGWGIAGYQGSGFYYFKPNYPIAITPS